MVFMHSYKREVEEAMKRVREVQQAIANAIEPSDKGT